MITVLELVRVKQWYKNLAVFIAIVFSLNFFDTQKLSTTILAFLSLILLSSANYALNDIVDKEKDRRHPEKRSRPLASKRISVAAASFAAVILAAAGFWLSSAINAGYMAISLVFFMTGIAYTLILKNIFLVDTITIAINFVLRAILGAVAINVPVSSWLIVCTFLLALTLVFGKRKMELLNSGYKMHRSVLRFYSADMLSGLSMISITSLFISYAIYTVSQPHSTYLPLTLPIATFLLFRYVSFLYGNDKAVENSENLLRQKGMILGFVAWVFAVMIILYFLK